VTGSGAVLEGDHPTFTPPIVAVAVATALDAESHRTGVVDQQRVLVLAHDRELLIFAGEAARVPHVGAIPAAVVERPGIAVTVAAIAIAITVAAITITIAITVAAIAIAVTVAAIAIAVTSVAITIAAIAVAIAAIAIAIAGHVVAIAVTEVAVAGLAKRRHTEPTDTGETDGTKLAADARDETTAARVIITPTRREAHDRREP
jgi:hypothetical protein